MFPHAPDFFTPHLALHSSPTHAPKLLLHTSVNPPPKQFPSWPRMLWNFCPIIFDSPLSSHSLSDCISLLLPSLKHRPPWEYLRTPEPTGFWRARPCLLFTLVQILVSLRFKTFDFTYLHTPVYALTFLFTEAITPSDAKSVPPCVWMASTSTCMTSTSLFTPLLH